MAASAIPAPDELLIHRPCGKWTPYKDFDSHNCDPSDQMDDDSAAFGEDTET